MIRLAFGNFLRFLRVNTFSFLLVFLCFVTSFGLYIFILEHGYETYIETADMQRETRTLYLHFDNSEGAADFYRLLQKDSSLPGIDTVTISGGDYSGIYKSSSDENNIYIPYGRYFTDQEAQDGSPVVLLAYGYLKTLNKDDLDTIWERGIDINGVHFNAVGNYSQSVALTRELDFQMDRLPNFITVPLQTFLDYNFPAERIRLVFADSLTKTQRVHLQEMVTSEGHVIFSALPLSGEKSATKEMISGMMAFSVILVISLISTVNVLFYWIKKELPRFRVYMICGAKNSKILFLIAAHTGFIVTLSYLCTLLLALIFRVFNILPEEFLAQMPWYAYGLIFAGGLIFSLLWTVLRAIPLVVRQKMIGR